jgi:hypothetical protein
MKPKDIKAGMSCTVGWFHTGFMGSRTDYLATGKIVCRRGGRIKFQWESGHEMDTDFISTPSYSNEFFWVSVLDIKSIDGIPIADWLKVEAVS